MGADIRPTQAQMEQQEREIAPQLNQKYLAEVKAGKISYPEALKKQQEEAAQFQGQFESFLGEEQKRAESGQETSVSQMLGGGGAPAPADPYAPVNTTTKGAGVPSGDMVAGGGGFNEKAPYVPTDGGKSAPAGGTVSTQGVGPGTSFARSLAGALSGVKEQPSESHIAYSAQAAERARQMSGAAAQRGQVADTGATQAAQMYADILAGKRPSLASAQLQAASERGLAQQLSTAASARGGSPASIQRALSRSVGSQTRELGQQAYQAGLQEQQQAAQFLQAQQAQEQALIQSYMQKGFDYETARTQAIASMEQSKRTGQAQRDIAHSQQQAGSAAGMMGAIGSIGAALIMGSDERMKKNVKPVSNPFEQKMEDEESDSEESSKSSKIASAFATGLGQAAEGMMPDYMSKMYSAGSQFGDAIGKAIASRANAPSPVGSRQMGGGMYMTNKDVMSDETQKKNKKGSDKEVRSFLDALKAKSYEYKDPTMPGTVPGRVVGVMAQDVEKGGPIGEDMVVQHPNGMKMLDMQKGFSAVLAAQANLNKRLAEMEKKKGKK